MMNRDTKQRAAVKEAVYQLKNHPTAFEVYQAVHKVHPHISQGTVYRNLNLLSNDSTLHHISIPGSADRFDHNTAPHYHLKCTECGLFSDIALPYNPQLDQAAHRVSGYRLKMHDIVFLGICPNCQNKASDC